MRERTRFLPRKFVYVVATPAHAGMNHDLLRAPFAWVVAPAYAGMNPPAAQAKRTAPRVTRACGDEPMALQWAAAIMQDYPRIRR